MREKHYYNIFKDSISDTNKKIKNLNKDLERNEKCLRESTTWMKFILIKYSVHRLVSKENRKTAERYDKKLTKLYVEKQIKDGIAEKPHKLITNLSRYELSSKEIEILKLGLRHGVATRPVESEMNVILENIWDQIKNAKVIRNDLSEQRIKTVLRAFTFNYINVDEKQFGIDGKRLKVLKELKKKITILKPDKGQGVVLLKHEDYTNCVEMLLTDRNKFKRIDKVPTIMRLNTV